MMNRTSRNSLLVSGVFSCLLCACGENQPPQAVTSNVPEKPIAERPKLESENPKEYTVKSGDSLTTIAVDHGFFNDWRELLDLNPELKTRPDFTLEVGEVLLMPGSEVSDTNSPDTAAPPDLPCEYIVQPGDSLSSIAGRIYGDRLKWKPIFEANKEVMFSEDDLYAGETILLPSLDNPKRTDDNTDSESSIAEPNEGTVTD